MLKRRNNNQIKRARSLAEETGESFRKCLFWVVTNDLKKRKRNKK